MYYGVLGGGSACKLGCHVLVLGQVLGSRGVGSGDESEEGEEENCKFAHDNVIIHF